MSKPIVANYVGGSGRIPAPGELTKKSTINERVRFAFDLIDLSVECPSSWGAGEIRSLFACWKKASQMTWMEVFKTGGKSGNKTGLGYTNFKQDPFPRPATISEDLQIAAMLQPFTASDLTRH